jgi:hypothetical protein
VPWRGLPEARRPGLWRLAILRQPDDLCLHVGRQGWPSGEDHDQIRVIWREVRRFLRRLQRKVLFFRRFCGRFESWSGSFLVSTREREPIECFERQHLAAHDHPVATNLA